MWCGSRPGPRTARVPAPSTVRDSCAASLRMRPDRIVVGEVRGGEALDLLQALNTGHAGSMCTIHANRCVDALRRLETLALLGGREPTDRRGTSPDRLGDRRRRVRRARSRRPPARHRDRRGGAVRRPRRTARRRRAYARTPAMRFDAPVESRRAIGMRRSTTGGFGVDRCVVRLVARLAAALVRRAAAQSATAARGRRAAVRRARARVPRRIDPMLGAPVWSNRAAIVVRTWLLLAVAAAVLGAGLQPRVRCARRRCSRSPPGPIVLVLARHRAERARPRRCRRCCGSSRRSCASAARWSTALRTRRRVAEPTRSRHGACPRPGRARCVARRRARRVGRGAPDRGRARRGRRAHAREPGRRPGGRRRSTGSRRRVGDRIAATAERVPSRRKPARRRS